MGTILEGIVHGGKIHGRASNHCHASACMFTPDCACAKPETYLSGKVKITCIRCGGSLSEANAKDVPFLCNRCRSVWKTSPLEISLAVAWSKRKAREELFLVAVNYHGMAGIFDPDYDQNPVHLGFVAGTKKANGEIRFFDPKLALNTLQLFKEH